MDYLVFNNSPDLVRVISTFTNVISYVDLEIIGKYERQKSTNSFQSDHQIKDIISIMNKVNPSELGVRINPVGDHTEKEINECIDLGVTRIMLPMFKYPEQVDYVKKIIKGRVKFELLFETPESVKNVKDFCLENIDYIHIGLNDLKIALHNYHMYELLVNNYLNYFTSYLKKNNFRYGIGGIGAIGSIPFSPKYIFAANLIIGSQRLILSRAFKNKLDFSTNEELSISFKKQYSHLENLRIEIGRLNSNELLIIKKEFIEEINKGKIKYDNVYSNKIK
tara:strand:- start:7269 stop:8105 length:837 start_codon:yes stop_codon:yes gene_type:complete